MRKGCDLLCEKGDKTCPSLYRNCVFNNSPPLRLITVRLTSTLVMSMLTVPVGKPVPHVRAKMGLAVTVSVALTSTNVGTQCRLAMKMQLALILWELLHVLVMLATLETVSRAVRLTFVQTVTMIILNHGLI